MQHALPLTEQTIAARLERLPYSRWHVRITVILGVAIFFNSFNSLAIAYLWASSYIISYSLQGWIPTLYREIYHLTLQQSLNYAVAAPLGSDPRLSDLRLSDRPDRLPLLSDEMPASFCFPRYRALP